MWISVTGIPGMTTLDKIDPFFINKIHFDQNMNNVLNLKADIRKVYVTGLGATIVKESKYVVATESGCMKFVA